MLACFCFLWNGSMRVSIGTDVTSRNRENYHGRHVKGPPESER